MKLASNPLTGAGAAMPCCGRALRGLPPPGIGPAASPVPHSPEIPKTPKDPTTRRSTPWACNPGCSHSAQLGCWQLRPSTLQRYCSAAIEAAGARAPRRGGPSAGIAPAPPVHPLVLTHRAGELPALHERSARCRRAGRPWRLRARAAAASGRGKRPRCRFRCGSTSAHDCASASGGCSSWRSREPKGADASTLAELRQRDTSGSKRASSCRRDSSRCDAPAQRFGSRRRRLGLGSCSARGLRGRVGARGVLARVRLCRHS